ncbi:MAG: hypothetical protein PHP82_00375 [Candidatus ainarchaeum sp.]|nr:hypothetical protein [Candidatus ainarchaeum sp.]
MSIYGPRIRLPRISIPKISFGIPNIGLKTIFALLLIILVIATFLFIFSNPKSFNPHISVYWKNNPLILEDDLTKNAELKLIIINNKETIQDINLEINSESKEIIIFCPDKEFPNVAPNHKRETICLIRVNPGEKVFSGTYQINVKTNLGETTSTLEIIK